MIKRLYAIASIMIYLGNTNVYAQSTEPKAIDTYNNQITLGQILTDEELIERAINEDLFDNNYKMETLDICYDGTKHKVNNIIQKKSERVNSDGEKIESFSAKSVDAVHNHFITEHYESYSVNILVFVDFERMRYKDSDDNEKWAYRITNFGSKLTTDSLFRGKSIEQTINISGFGISEEGADLGYINKTINFHVDWLQSKDENNANQGFSEFIKVGIIGGYMSGGTTHIALTYERLRPAITSKTVTFSLALPSV